MMAIQSSGYATPSRISKAGWGLHPAICRQNPEGRHRRADGDGDGRREMQRARYPVPTEQHDAEEGGFQKKSPHHLVTDHRPNDVAENAASSGSS